MKKIRLTAEEKRIEKASLSGEYKFANEKEVQALATAIKNRKKDAVLYIRLNQEDLNKIKSKAKHYKVPYQTLISEYLHKLAS